MTLHSGRGRIEIQRYDHEPGRSKGPVQICRGRVPLLMGDRLATVGKDSDANHFPGVHRAGRAFRQDSIIRTGYSLPQNHGHN